MKKSTNKKKSIFNILKKMQLDIVDISARDVMNVLVKLDILSYIEKELKNINFDKINNDLAFRVVRQIVNKNEYYKSEQSIAKSKYLWNVLMNSKWDYTLAIDSHCATVYSVLFYCFIRNIVTTGILTGYIKQLENKKNKR